MPCLIVLVLVSRIMHFLQSEGLWQSCIEQVCAIFPTACAHFESLCHIWVILFFIMILCNGDLGSVIVDVLVAERL